MLFCLVLMASLKGLREVLANIFMLLSGIFDLHHRLGAAIPARPT